MRLDKRATETYPQRFWGNIDDLRSKVLQSLNRKEEDFDKRLLRVEGRRLRAEVLPQPDRRYH